MTVTLNLAKFSHNEHIVKNNTYMNFLKVLYIVSLFFSFEFEDMQRQHIAA